MSSYDCGGCIAKYILCLFNFVFFLAGTAVLSVGIWLAVDKDSFIALTKTVAVEQLHQFSQPAVIEQAAYILIAAGASMFIVSFLGYCGALRESQCLLTAYGVCLVIILIMEIVAGGLAAAYRNTAQEETRTFLKTTISKYYAADKPDAVSLMWNHLMAQMSCCGVDDYRDFKDSPKWASGNKTVPDACCVLNGDVTLFQVKDSDCPYHPTDSNSYYQKGCYNAIINWIMSHTDIIIGIGIGVGLVQLLGIFLSFCLCSSFRHLLTRTARRLEDTSEGFFTMSEGSTDELGRRLLRVGGGLSCLREVPGPGLHRPPGASSKRKRTQLARTWVSSSRRTEPKLLQQ